MTKTPISQGDIKLFIARQVKDDVRQLRRELAIHRLNINKAIGVGNLTDFIREWEYDFPNSTTSVKPVSEKKNKTLKRVTQTKKRVKL